MRLRVLLADDHPAYRSGIARAIADDRRLELVGEAESGDGALARIREVEPDVALLDVRMPGLDGIGLVRALVNEGTETRVLLLSAFTDGALIHEALAVGAAGYLSKEATEEEICEAIVRAAHGERAVSPTLHQAVFEQVRRGGRRPLLSPRERQVLSLSASGCSTADIGAELHLSPSTVKSHLKNVCEKLETPNTTAAVAEAIRLNLLETNPEATENR